ncbi:MAG: hypothetical protein F9K35_13800 [Burkholderiaceae bacterium]|nr:MAG: hypothetical protein F9K35_13800 [Burkholderiaceae bacterium]
MQRVSQRDWDQPDLHEWLASLQGQIGELPTPPVLAAHSLGCALVAHWVRRTIGRGDVGPIQFGLQAEPRSRRRRCLPMPTPTRWQYVGTSQ